MSRKRSMPDADFLKLLSMLEFCPHDGRITLGDRRMALFHAECFATLRRELIDTLGTDTARGLLTRMGYQSGALDAEMLQRQRYQGQLSDAFSAGPWLHMIEGKVIVEPVRFEIDVARGHCYLEAIWHHSIEVDCHSMFYGRSAAPVCWMEVGRAAGWASTFLGRAILCREVECRGAGDKVCRIVGKPLETWDDGREDMRYLQPETFVNRLVKNEIRNHGASAGTHASSGVVNLVGRSSGFIAASHLVSKVAQTHATVLFLGETGVGKSAFAENLHRISARSEGPFLAVNCAAIPENLMEAELFGVEKGAYTGAQASRPGRFERAHGGTLFLDEIGALSLQAQGKLLHVLQTGEIERVGDTRVRRVDVRVVSATNEDLLARAKDGTFRRDLFYRLNVFPIKIPSLRERREDLPLLADQFLRCFSTFHGKRISGFSERGLQALLAYDYPGNIRELENLIERAVILSSDDAPLDVFSLFGEIEIERSFTSTIPRKEGVLNSLLAEMRAGTLDMDEIMAAVAQGALAEANGNVAAAARALQTTRRKLSYRLAKAGMRASETTKAPARNG